MTTLMEFSGHPLVHALGWTLLHFCGQGTLVAVVLWSVLGVLSGRSSQARYGAACFALLLLIAMPLITFARIASAAYKTRAELLGLSIPIDPGMFLQVGANEAAVPWPVRIAIAMDHSMPWLLAAWFAGVIFFVARLNFGLLVARRLKTADTDAPPAELLQSFDALRVRLGILRAVSLLHSVRVQVPTVIGWLRPVVLIPASCLTGLSTEQIAAIFCHELAHVRRHDYLVSVFQSVAEALLFYHPAVWWVSKQIRRERECCCDEVAVGNGGDVLAYAKALSYLEERRASFPEFVLGANGGVLTMRIKRLLGCRENAAASQFAAFTVLAVLLAAAGSYVVTVARAQQKQAEPTVASVVTPVHAMSLAQESVTQNSTDAPQLRGVYKTWIEQDVTYIITPEERAAFLKLANDEERDRFIENFWQRRNPTPGENSNTFRDGHYARIAYTNEHFATNDRPGWKTDRGHIYIAYGPPNSIDSHPTGSGPSAYPFEMWHYTYIPGIGDNVTLEFVDTCRCGDYKYTIDRLEQPTAASGSANQQSTFANINLAARIMSSPRLPGPDSDSARATQGDGAIAGTILDPTGAVVPRANVRASNVGTGLTLTQVTDNSGTYSFSPLPAGRYKIEVAARGFQNLAQENVQVDAAQKVGLNLKLRVGSVSQNLTVSASRNPVAVASQPAMAAAALPPAPPPPPPPPPAPLTAGADVKRPIGPLRISSGVAAGMAISMPQPVYPPDAKAAHVQGVVVLHAIISKAGSVEDLQVVSGPTLLIASALDAVRQWQYKPYLLNGEPTEVETTININYTLNDSADSPGQSAAAEYEGAPLRKIGGSVSPPTVIYQVDPEYSPDAKVAKFNGIVLVHLIVDVTGTPRNVQVLRGVGLGLDEKAVEAVKQYRFKPAMEGGEPVPVSVNIEVNFRYF